LHAFGTEASLAEGTRLLYQRIALSVEVEACGERGVLLAERINVGILRLEEAVDRE
jgi:hypothetical protein